MDTRHALAGMFTCCGTLESVPQQHMVDTTVLVHRRDSNGRPFSLRLWHELDARCAALCGGATRDSQVDGFWTDHTGRVYRDKSIRYSLTLQSARDLPGWIALMEWILVAFSQEAIYITINGRSEIIPKREG